MTVLVADKIVTGKNIDASGQRHLLILKRPDGFVWQIRHGWGARHITESAETYPAAQMADQAGRAALALFMPPARNDLPAD